MKKIIVTSAILTILINCTQAQYFNFKKKSESKEDVKPVAASLLNDWQKAHNKQIVFFDNWLGSRADETEADASKTIELGEDFWIRSYFEPVNMPKNPMDLRVSCEGVSLSLKDLWQYGKTNYANTHGILPAYDQLVLPSADNWWKNANVWSMCGTAATEDFEKAGSAGYACMYNSYPAECLVRMLLAKIDAKVVAGANLNVKFELLEKSDASYFESTGTWTPVSEGTLTFHVGDKAKLLNNNYYGFMRSGLDDMKVEESIKKAILSMSNDVISEVQKIDIISNDFQYYKNDLGVPIYKWITVRIIFKSKIDGILYAGNVNASFNYNGSTYDANPAKLFYQCGIMPVNKIGLTK